MESGDFPDHPVADAAESIMVEGEVADFSVGLDPRPRFPDGRCAVVHLIQPGRALFLQEHLLRKIYVTVVHQHIQQIRDRQEACVEAFSVGYDQFRQPLDCLLLGRSAQQAESDRNHVATL
ncbi:hypothetical protein SDC9_192023 [bioreactor metagenome]|uniref:Uncharacterized protein n=1 Tax=bioreactor metagenome TaxID=1076179 RepID=A0A645HZM8_9ZZZZ